jgi:hypothetical protein
MPHPEAGQPFVITPGLRLSIGDPDAALGTDAYNGVVVLEAGAPSPYIVDDTDSFDIKAYFKTNLGFVPFPLPGTFSVEFHFNDLQGNPVAGSPFAGDPLVVPDVPAGAAVATPPDVVTWHSSTATIPASTLAPGSTYRVTTHGYDAAGMVFAFHDGTIIHTY